METNVTVRRAEELIVARAVVLATERVALRNARGRILREATHADDDSPRFDCSAVDGYALRRVDVCESLNLIGEIQAGTHAALEIGARECVRIFTGARVPPGADYVAMQEDVEAAQGQVRVRAQSDGTNIRHRGENCRRGDVVVPARRELRSAELAALASCGVTQPIVTRRPRVIHLVTGDELVDPAAVPHGTQLRDSNSTLVASFLEASGADLVRQERVPDSIEESNAVADSLGRDFDLLLVSGGASVGAYDFARPMLEHAGFERDFQNVNLRPGKPLALFARDGSLAFALPGNPVSHWVILNLFIGPLLAAMSAAPRTESRLRGQLVDAISQKPNRRETQLPAVATIEAGEFRVCARRFASSGDVGSVAGANALVEVPADSAGFAAGEQVTFILCR
ncbi:MAG: molybdopterin molybdotransferase MoeA [Verrucomicrobiota bacterium]|nr:molybdopterin molybdotransferase MoeA [Verrucomicrobiota bacterium]